MYIYSSFNRAPRHHTAAHSGREKKIRNKPVSLPITITFVLDLYCVAPILIARVLNIYLSFIDKKIFTDRHWMTRRSELMCHRLPVHRNPVEISTSLPKNKRSNLSSLDDFPDFFIKDTLYKQRLQSKLILISEGQSK